MGKAHHVCDVLVVGAGPAGLAAAWRVAQSGLRVGVVDDNPAAGGQIWRGEQVKPSSPEAQEWFERIRSVDIQMINGARVFQQPEAGMLLAESSEGVYELKYESLVLATGARERFLPFPGWTLPNVMGAGGLQALVKTGLPIEGKRVVVAGSGPLLLAVAAYMRRCGADVMLIAEQASMARLIRFGLGLFGSKKFSQAWALKKEFSRKGATAQRVKYVSGCWVLEAHGNEKLESVTLFRGGKRWEVACDYLACGFHLVPNVELAELLGCAVNDGSVKVDEYQTDHGPECLQCWGEHRNRWTWNYRLSKVRSQDWQRPANVKQRGSCFQFVRSTGSLQTLLNRTFALRDELKHLAAPETIVCRCEDVTFERLRTHRSWRAAKLQTRCGMGPCQGRVCGGAVEFLFGWRAESVRPPVLPVRVESLIRNNP